MTFWEFANNLRKTGELCDICLHVLNKQGELKSLQAHKVIVAYCSPYLSELISGDSVEDVTVSEVTEETLECILDMIYHQKSVEDLITLDNFQEVVRDLKALDVDLRDERLNAVVYSQMESTDIQTKTQESVGTHSEAGYEVDATGQRSYTLLTPKIEYNHESSDIYREINAASIESSFNNGDHLHSSQHVESIISDLSSVDLVNKPDDLLTQSCRMDIFTPSLLTGVSEENDRLVEISHKAEKLETRTGLCDMPSKDCNSQLNLSKELPGDKIIGKCDTIGSTSPREDNEDSPRKSRNSIVKLELLQVKEDTEVIPESQATEDSVNTIGEGFFCSKENDRNTTLNVVGSGSKRKKKNKEISMDVLKRFCAKQADRKKKTAALGSEAKDTGVEISCQLKDAPNQNNGSLKVNPENSSRQPGSVTCEFCGMVLQSVSLWERHVLTHSGERPFECETCGKRYSAKGNLVVHQKSHGHRERKFECSVCLARFLTKGALKIHSQNMHTAVAPSKCEHCDALFKSAYSLKTHIETKHKIKQVLSCDDCEKTFTNPMYLKRHKLTHTDNLPFPCKHCPLAFRTYGARATHMSMLHTKEMFICDACGNSYHSKSVLLAHRKRVHVDKDPSRECPICHKYVSNFYNHIRMHKSYEKGEVFSCLECGKTFPLKTYLQQHMHVHRKKRFSCSNCQKKFTFNASLQSHLKNCMQRKVVSTSSLLPFHITQCEKQSPPIVQVVSGLNFKNIQRTIQQPFVFKYQYGNYGNILPKETPALKDMDETAEDEIAEEMDELVDAEEIMEAEMINQTITRESTTESLAVTGEEGGIESHTEASLVLQDHLGRTEESTQGMRSIRIQPGDSGKPIMIEQTFGQEFSEDQLASIVSSLGVESLKGEVQYVCILPQ